MIQRILLALDSSDLAGLVLDAAIAAARKEGARLRLLHVVDVPPNLPPGLVAATPCAITEHFLGLGREVVGEHAKAVPRELLAGVDVRMGRPWREICAIAKEAKADLIVIGAHGPGVVDRMLGTTAATIVSRAHCSVLFVRPEGRRLRPARPSGARAS